MAPAGRFVPIQLAARQAEQECSSATMRLAQAQTMGEVVRLSQVHVPSHLRSLVRPALSRLEAAAARRISDIFQVQTKAFEALSANEQERQLDRLRQDWNLLRGHFPRESAQAQRYLQKAYADLRPDS